MRPAAFLLACLFAGAVACPAAAQDPVTIERGAGLAKVWCSSCHLVGTGDQASALADAPPFATLATRPGFGDDALAIALFRPHPPMPRFDIGRSDIRALAAYIASLRDEAATAAPADRGRALAEAACAPCHAIAGDGPGPNPDAPPFARFARNWPIESLAEALAEGIVVSHDAAMPEFAFDPVEVGALIGYIESVQR